MTKEKSEKNVILIDYSVTLKIWHICYGFRGKGTFRSGARRPATAPPSVERPWINGYPEPTVAGGILKVTNLIIA